MSYPVNRALLQASRVVAGGASHSVPGPPTLAHLHLGPLSSAGGPPSGPSTPTTSSAVSRSASPVPTDESISASASRRESFSSTPALAPVPRRKSTGSVGFGPRTGTPNAGPAAVRATVRQRVPSFTKSQGSRHSFTGPATQTTSQPSADPVDVSTSVCALGLIKFLTFSSTQYVAVPRLRRPDLRLNRTARASAPGPSRPVFPLTPLTSLPSTSLPGPLSAPVGKVPTGRVSDAFSAEDSALDLDEEVEDPFAVPMGARVNPSAGPVDTGPRLAVLKKLMADHGVNAYLVPTEDAHASEYITPADARRSHITGFTGSAGTALILSGDEDVKSLLFTDGRYFNQAGQQLDPRYWDLMKQGVENVPTWSEYLTSRARDLHARQQAPLRVGIDPETVSASEADKLTRALRPYDGKIVPLKQNLVDVGWGTSRPARPAEPIFHLGEEITGKSTAEKVAELRKELLEKKNESGQDGSNVLGTVVTALDDLAWLFNLRGNDIPYNPVFFAYAWIATAGPTSPSDGPLGDVKLFISTESLAKSSGIKTYLSEIGVQVQPYEAIWDTLEGVGKAARSTGQKVLIPSRASLAVAEALNHGAKTLSSGSHPTISNGNGNGNGNGGVVEMVRSPVGDLKAIKNPVEIEGFRKSHVRDGAALVSYFAWLEDELVDRGRTDLTEYQAAEELERRRAKVGGETFKGLSFDTISATGPNGAVIHYSPDPKESRVVDKDEVYLCDSGGQYIDGTTDVTRTMVRDRGSFLKWTARSLLGPVASQHFGTPTEEQVRAFTRVLQGHIAIDTSVFPKGTTGFALDAFARRPLWQDGLDYRHGCASLSPF